MSFNSNIAILLAGEAVVPVLLGGSGTTRKASNSFAREAVESSEQVDKLLNNAKKKQKYNDNQLTVSELQSLIARSAPQITQLEDNKSVYINAIKAYKKYIKNYSDVDMVVMAIEIINLLTDFLIETEKTLKLFRKIQTKLKRQRANII